MSLTGILDRAAMIEDSLTSDCARQPTERAKGAGAFPWSFWGSCLVLAILFAQPISAWVGLARNNELYSHVPLIPFVTVYLLWSKRSLFRSPRPGGWIWKSLPLLGGVVFATSLSFGLVRSWHLPSQNWVSLTMTLFLALLLANALAFFGWSRIRLILLPLLFLFFAVPFPESWETAIEGWYQQSSAVAAANMIEMARTPVVRDGLILHLPNLSIQVAPECSGIRSSLVLFITSVLAGYTLLRTPSRRLWLSLFVIPLGVIRNGFRIFVICELCVHVNPTMIDSWIHHKGGPLFFVLSLCPFFLLLVWLRRSENRVVEAGLAGAARATDLEPPRESEP